MKKNLDARSVLNELKQGSRFFGAPAPAEYPPAGAARKASLPQMASTSTRPSTDRLTDRSTSRSTGQLTRWSTSRPTERSTNESMHQLTEQSTMLERPKAFYITSQQDADLDTAVSKLAVRGASNVGQKVDRSTVIRLLLDEARLTSEHTIERLHQRLIKGLIRQLSSQPAGRLDGRLNERL